jgi:hypothetical protein
VPFLLTETALRTRFWWAAALVAGVHRLVARAPHEQLGSSLYLLFHELYAFGQVV